MSFVLNGLTSFLSGCVFASTHGWLSKRKSYKNRSQNENANYATNVRTDRRTDGPTNQSLESLAHSLEGKKFLGTSTVFL